ncbi:hypothetical protein IFR05_003105 [Cadophora sp. M221]|nr:hypothetical protein IFR05_003105 [Cadophora sp. M221]
MSTKHQATVSDQEMNSENSESISSSMPDYVVDIERSQDASIDVQDDKAIVGPEYFREGHDFLPETKTQIISMTEDMNWKGHQSTNRVYGLGSGLTFPSEEIGGYYQECWSFNDLPSPRWKQPEREIFPYARLESPEPLDIKDLANADLDNTTRDHPLYHNVKPQADGLYHCPWEKGTTANCQHRPEKLKCNYE